MSECPYKYETFKAAARDITILSMISKRIIWYFQRSCMIFKRKDMIKQIWRVGWFDVEKGCCHSKHDWQETCLIESPLVGKLDSWEISKEDIHRGVL